MLQNRCQHNLLQSFEQHCYIFRLFLPMNFKFLQDAILGIILHSYKCYHLILIIEFVPKIKYFVLIECSSAKLIKKFSDVAFSGFEVSVTNNLPYDILLPLIPFL